MAIVNSVPRVDIIPSGSVINLKEAINDTIDQAVDSVKLPISAVATVASVCLIEVGGESLKVAATTCLPGFAPVVNGSIEASKVAIMTGSTTVVPSLVDACLDKTKDVAKESINRSLDSIVPINPSSYSFIQN